MLAWPQRKKAAMQKPLALSLLLLGLLLGLLPGAAALAQTLITAPPEAVYSDAQRQKDEELKDCATDFHTTALADADLAMLKALYQTPNQPENLQMTRLVGNMQRNLQGEARK